VSESCGLFKFLSITENVLEMIQDRDSYSRRHHQKSYVAYQIAPIPTSLGDWPWMSLAVWNLSNSYILGKYSTCYLQCLRVNWKVHMVCNFNCLFKIEGLLSVSGSQIVMYAVKVVISQKWCKIETLLLHPQIGYMTCQIVALAIAMTLNQSHWNCQYSTGQWPSRSFTYPKAFLNGIFLTGDFNWHSASCVPYATFVLLV